MKKQLLLLFALFSFFLSSAQFNNPIPMHVCQGSDVYFADQTSQILNGQSPVDFMVTYHFTQADATAGQNALSDPSVFMMSQVIFVRITEIANPANFQINLFELIVNPVPAIANQDFTQCDNDGIPDGLTPIDLGAVAEQIWATTPGGSPSAFSILFYVSMADAQTGVNPLMAPTFMNVTSPQTLYYVASDNVTGCSVIASVDISVTTCGTCPAPSMVTASDISSTSAVLGWASGGSETLWQYVVLPAGMPFPVDAGMWTNVEINPVVVTGLSCGTAYEFYVRSWCTNGLSPAVGPFGFVTPCIPEVGQPQNLEACSDTIDACFDLTQNNDNVLGTLDTANYTITYYATEADAFNQINPIENPSMYCVSQFGMASIEVYVRLNDLANEDWYISPFGLTVRQVEASNFTPLPMYECDSDANGVVVFNLTEVASQLNTSNPLSYYTDSQAATSASGANALTSPQAFEMTTTSGTVTMTIFVRENITGACDIVYSLQLMASSNCNLANVCSNANSLCSALGVPFSNTTNNGAAQPGIDYDCLFTQPNPTWFFLPISEAGDLSFHMEQVAFMGGGIDVDFICWGPFDSPVTPCSGPAYLNVTTQIACSYSAAATEDFTIVNAQPGQFYLLMITNFSNQPGLITVTQSNVGAPSSGEIDCSGLRLTAFVDDNGNGTKEAAENTFSLGQFHYEKNNNSVTHHLTSISGIAHIYDINPANTYDINYTVDAMYASYYTVSPSSYSDVSVPAGGLAEYLFPVTLTQAYDDLAVSIIPNSPPMPGFTYSYTILYTNLGSQTMAAGTITFTKPSNADIALISEGGATTNASGFVFNFTNLLQGETREIVVTMQVPTIPTVELGQAVTAMVDIVPLDGDIAPENNSATTTQIIVGSWDPNDKSESRGSYVLFNDFGADDYLYYTIRFENEGTAAAQTVKINDVLESQLDETSVRMVAASHDYVLDRTGSVLNWTFSNINLPFASEDADGAKGYVQFKVKPKPGYALGDVIENTASIYFDYNPAIVTNTFQTHFVQSMGVPGVSATAFAMYPNPAGDHVTVSLNGASDTISGITVYDMLGKKVLVKSSVSNAEMLDVSTLSSGMYFLEVMTAAHIKSTKKLVIK
jgi:uncharacterized repeat protein (TIGR01451 family)